MLNTSILCSLKPLTEWFISLTKPRPVLDGNPWNLKLHINRLKDGSEVFEPISQDRTNKPTKIHLVLFFPGRVVLFGASMSAICALNEVLVIFGVPFNSDKL